MLRAAGGTTKAAEGASLTACSLGPKAGGCFFVQSTVYIQSTSYLAILSIGKLEGMSSHRVSLIRGTCIMPLVAWRNRYMSNLRWSPPISLYTSSYSVGGTVDDGAVARARRARLRRQRGQSAHARRLVCRASAQRRCPC